MEMHSMLLFKKILSQRCQYLESYVEILCLLGVVSQIIGEERYAFKNKFWTEETISKTSQVRSILNAN